MESVAELESITLQPRWSNSLNVNASSFCSESPNDCEVYPVKLAVALTGWYGGVAVEMMALSKTVVCYLREDDLKFIDSRMRADLPLIQATPSTIYKVLKDCLTRRRAELAELGARSRAYVEKWHDPVVIAALLKEQYVSALQRARGSTE